MPITRRQFAAGAAGLALLSKERAHAMPDRLPSLIGGRFLTFNSIIRVNQIEVTRSHNVGADEGASHTPARVQAMRDALERGMPGARMTWAFSWLALQDPRPNYRAIRELVVGFQKRFGDEITFIPGAYFAPMYNSRAQVNADLHDALAMIEEMVGGRYRPRSVVAGFLAADNLRYLAEHEGIHVAQGNIWSQYGIDNGDGDGAPSYPYYPSREHFLKPAQAKADFVDCVNLDGWTCDFLAARRAGFEGGFNSRMGVGPIETVGAHGPEVGLRQMVATTAAHFDAGYDLNRFAWVTNCWEVSLADMIPIENLARWMGAVHARWPDAKCITQGEFGQAWRKHFRDNAKWDYRFVQRGTGIGGSDEKREIRWFMNRRFRLALLRDADAPGSERVIDLTRYDLPAKEPADARPDAPTRNWSLMNRINQKRTRPQDQPVPLADLTAADRELIARHYPELLR